MRVCLPGNFSSNCKARLFKFTADALQIHISVRAVDHGLKLRAQVDRMSGGLYFAIGRIGCALYAKSSCWSLQCSFSH